VGHLFMFLVGGKTPDQSVHLNLTTTDIAKIKRGISTYLEPSRAQPVLPQDISGQYQREGEQ
ncbi:RAQPRD family integrative conjugative element protein, partial [Klebsiella pneumoniae]